MRLRRRLLDAGARPGEPAGGAPLARRDEVEQPVVARQADGTAAGGLQAGRVQAPGLVLAVLAGPPHVGLHPVAVSSSVDRTYRSSSRFR
ncbi:hypothetical protein [Saccharothrix saharensis]|uniref:hypothetical protein n=1 Tax=Saccharothrix saharensis TaxID=571190 RepID=UPI00114F12DD|nr:hypothetical protein [Saccharothrix saharensis]